MADNARRSFLRGRESARRLAMQAIYQWQLAGTDIEEIIEQFQQEESYSRADRAYFVRLLREVTVHAEEIGEKISAIAGYRFELIDPVERSIMMNAACEILFIQGTDKAVAIAEAVRLAKKFGASEGYRFVNGVLDKI